MSDFLESIIKRDPAARNKLYLILIFQKDIIFSCKCCFLFLLKVVSKFI